MRVDLDNLECRSAFDVARDRVTVVGPAGAPGAFSGDIRLVELADVVYLPSILELGQSVCVAEGRFVPAESLLDCRSIEFVKQARRTSPSLQGRYAEDLEPEWVDRRVCILGNLFSRNFGHWTEELLKVAVLEHAAVDCDYVMAALPLFARDSLVLLGVNEDRILSVDAPTVFSRAVFTTAVSHENISSYPDVLFRLRHLVESRVGAGASRCGPRLWLERGEGLRNGGVITNREEVYDCVSRFGFEVVDLATVALADQWRAMAQATAIAGPHGAQFVQAQFMPPSSTVIECFSPTHVNPSILQICRVLKHRYHQIVARSHMTAAYPHGRDCRVDCEHLTLVLDSIEPQSFV